MIKSLVKKIVPRSILEYRNGYSQLHRMNPAESKWALLRNGIVLRPCEKIDQSDDFIRQFDRMTRKAHISTETYYIYPFDTMMIRLWPKEIAGICSITADFGKILKTDLNALRNELKGCTDKNFSAREIGVIEAIEHLAVRIESRLSGKETERIGQLASYFPAMLYRMPQSLDEAIQKLLFYDALFWQAGHRHIGLGRLDEILNEYYESDVAAGRLTDSEAKKLLAQLILTLGKDTRAKSGSLIGDTGQYILLGGESAMVGPFVIRLR